MTRICKYARKGLDCSEWEQVCSVSCRGHELSCPYFEEKPKPITKYEGINTCACGNAKKHSGQFGYCEDSDIKISRHETDSGCSATWIACGRCGLQLGNEKNGFNTDEEAILAWNNEIERQQKGIK